MLLKLQFQYIPKTFFGFSLIGSFFWLPYPSFMIVFSFHMGQQNWKKKQLCKVIWILFLLLCKLASLGRFSGSPWLAISSDCHILCFWSYFNLILNPIFMKKYNFHRCVIQLWISLDVLLELLNYRPLARCPSFIRVHEVCLKSYKLLILCKLYGLSMWVFWVIKLLFFSNLRLFYLLGKYL